MKQPLVSVVLPTYNHPATLREALLSVREQAYGNMEIVVVDDGSGSETQRLLVNLQQEDSRVRVVKNAENKGFVQSLNKGISEAAGEYIARIDDDDAWCDKEKVKKQAEFLQNNPEYALVGGGIIRVDSNGKEISRELLPEHDADIRNRMLVADPFAHVSVMFRKADWEAVGEYEESFDYAQDWELWMKLGKRGNYYNFQEYFVRSTFLPAGRSARNMRHHLWMNLVARTRHKHEFSHFWKGYMLGLVSYFFSFIPIRYRIQPFFLKMKQMFIR